MKLKYYGILITIEEDYIVEAKSTYLKTIVKRFDKRKDMMKYIKKIEKVIGKEVL